MKVDISQISLTSSSTTARKGKTFKKKLDNDIHSYYEYVTTKDMFSSQTNISPDRTNLFKIDTYITIKTHAELISKDLNSKINILGKQCIPSCFDILKTVGFENPDSDHSFTSEACFEHTLLHLLKSNYLLPQDSKAVIQYYPLFKNLNRMMTWSKTIDFSLLMNFMSTSVSKNTLPLQESNSFLRLHVTMILISL